MEFEHRDLHWGNVLIQRGGPDLLGARLRYVLLLNAPCIFYVGSGTECGYEVGAAGTGSHGYMAPRHLCGHPSSQSRLQPRSCAGVLTFLCTPPGVCGAR